MALKYHLLIVFTLALIHCTPTKSNSIFHAKAKGQSISLHNCDKDKLLDFPEVNFITELKIHNCFVPSVENAFFIKFSALTHLELIDSQLTLVEDYAFHGLRQLNTLSLAHNNITEVRSWSNEPMISLINLDLKRNAIQVLTLKSFYRYPNLQRLHLAGNLLEDIDDGIFRWMPHLKYLNLGRNRLITLDNRNFHGMHRLTYLALHFNDIGDIESASFDTNSNLRTLRLEGNRLRDLDFLKVKSLVRLQHLNLSFNLLDSLESLTFSKDYELVDLDLSHNQLREITDDVFMGLEALESLNISFNNLEHVAPKAFDQLCSLEIIQLNHNQISSMSPDLFNATRQLQHINLSNNQLNNINSTLFTSLAYLKSLDLSHNQLANDEFIEALAHADIAQYQDLQLNLADNHFRLVNITAVINFGQVELAGNWWSCKWLVREMLRMPKSVHFGKTYTVNTEWSLSLLEANGVDCYDEDRKRSIIILDTAKLWDQRMEFTDCGLSLDVPPSPPPLLWPKIRFDRFDSRSVVIWMLIAIGLAFSALRIARKLVDQNERRKKLRELRVWDSSDVEKILEALSSLQDTYCKNRCHKEKIEHNQPKLPRFEEAETDSLNGSESNSKPKPK